MTLSTIAMFWDGPPLGYIERLCTRSFVDAGHAVVMFSYSKVEGLPDGVERASASDILADPKTMIRHARTESPAPFADKFRYELLAKNDGVIWADTDAYCHKPFEPKDGYFFGRENDNTVANGVMAVPAISPTLKALKTLCSDEFAIPGWVHRADRAVMEQRIQDGNPMHISEMPWGAWGPKAFSHSLKEFGEFDRALEPHVLYPVSFRDRRLYFRSAHRTWAKVKEDTVSIHFYGRRCREFLRIRHDNIPPEGSVLADLGVKHGISP